jgi:hypothetical protein
LLLLAFLTTVVASAFVGTRPWLSQHLEIRVDGVAGTFAFDGADHAFTLPSPIQYLSIPASNPLLREYQIDGSDSTNNNNLDLDYFSQFASHPYYRFESWMRDTDSFNQWSHVRVVAQPSGQTIEPRHNDGSVSFAVPPSFTLSADIFRVETPIAVQLTEGENGYGRGVAIQIDRNDHRLNVFRLGTEQSTTEQVQWFYPNDPRPFLAEHVDTVAHVLVWSLFLTIVTLALTFGGAFAGMRARSWGKRRRGLPLNSSNGTTDDSQLSSEGARQIRRALPLVALLFGVLALCLMLTVATVDFQRHPHIFDADAYYFAGHIISLGRVSVPAPPVPAAFPGPFMAIAHGAWFAQYPPGAPLTLALGFKLHAVWLVGPAVALLTLLVCWHIARLQHNSYVAFLTVLLLVSSPFFSLQSTSFLSHAICLFYLACCYLAATLFDVRPGALIGAVAALCFVLAGYTRELATLLFAAPLVCYGALRLARRRELWGVRVLWCIPGLVIVVCGIAGYLTYNLATTGNAFLPARLAANPFDRFGFGDGIGFYGRHTLAAGLLNVDEMLTNAQFILFGWPYYLTFAFIPLPFLFGKSTGWDRVNAAIVLAFLAGYVGYFYHGIALGPRYLYESLPAYVMLTARGVETLATQANIWVRTWTKQTSKSGWHAVHGVVAALLLCDVLYFLPRQLVLYHDYTYLPDRPHIDFSTVYQAPVHYAVVISRDSRLYGTTLFPLNDPLLNGDIVWAFGVRPDMVAALQAAFPGREVYELEVSPAGISYRLVTDSR